MHENDWPLGDLTPGTYTMTSTGDGPGGAVVTDDGRLLVEQHDGYWADLTSVWRPTIGWEFDKHEPHATAQCVTTEHENILTPPLMLVRYAGMASLLTTVWESRRKLQDQNTELKGRVADTKILMGRHVDALYERIYGEQKRHQEELARLQIKQQKSAARVAELEAFVADIACHGLRLDVDASTSFASEDPAAGLMRNVEMLDRYLREDARRFVPDANRPYDAGRPRPVPRVEVVAECVTELDVLRAQDGAQ